MTLRISESLARNDEERARRIDRDRSNHTGTQLIETVEGLNDQLDAKTDLVRLSTIKFASPADALDLPLGAQFETSDRRYRRIAAAPGYEDMGDGAAPISKVALDSAVDPINQRTATLAVGPEDALLPGENIAVDAGPAIRRILAAGTPLRLTNGLTYVVQPDPASHLGGADYGYCIKVPSGAVIVGEGGWIKQAAGAPNWCRTVIFALASGFRVQGVLRVDANIAAISGTGNEHMHGVFFFDSSDFKIDAIESINARGDNVYFGGTDNSRGSCDGEVGSIIAVKAGRKNLVFQASDNVRITNADLDNRAGGAAAFGGVADSSDGNCLDVEPDANDGSVVNRIWITNLRTRGAGNDFSSGVLPAQSAAIQVNITKWSCEITSRATTAWLTTYGCSINVNEWHVSGITAPSPIAEIFYSTRLRVGLMTITGARADATAAFMLIARSGANVPRVEIDDLAIEGVGEGIENREAYLRIGKYRARTTGQALWARGVTADAGIFAETYVDLFDIEDIGRPLNESRAALVSTSGNVPVTVIKHIRFRDSRATKISQIVDVAAAASPGLVIGSVDNDTAVAVIGGGAGVFYREAGGGTAPARIICRGSPEAIVAAPVGSMAVRIDGAAGTTLYLKETGAGNTGWVAK